MREKRLLCILIMLSIFCLLGAMPAWEIKVYPQSTVAYGFVTIEGEPAEEGDIVYAFVLQECRGKQPVKVHEDKAYLTMNIQGMTDHEPVYFKVWDASADSVYEVNYTTFTKPNGDLGYPPDVLPINGVKAGVTYFFPPAELEMHPFELRVLDLNYYCNTTSQISTVEVTGGENLKITKEGLKLSIATETAWKGEEEIEIELLNSSYEVIEYGSVLIIVTDKQ